MQLIELTHYVTINPISLYAVPYEADEGTEFEYIETYWPRDLFTLPQFMQKALIVINGIEVKQGSNAIQVFVQYHMPEKGE